MCGPCETVRQTVYMLEELRSTIPMIDLWLVQLALGSDAEVSNHKVVPNKVTESYELHKGT